MDELDRKLLAVIQTDLPVVARPWAELAVRLGTGEEEVLRRIAALKAAGVIRQISAIFDSQSLGYDSCLVAAQVDPARLDAAAAVINTHPGVSHNYQRDHAFNLWYTIAVAANSRFGLRRTVQILHEQSGARSTRLLPTLQRFKIGVELDVEGTAPADAKQAGPSSARQQQSTAPLSEADIRYVQEMQQDLPVEPTPFLAVANRLGVSLAELQRQTAALRACGRLRRISAVLHHRRIGFTANGMAVWAVPGDEAQIQRIGEQMATFRAVTHCYRRPIYPDWPYNLFTMIHARSRTACEAVAEQIARQTAITEYAILYSIREYKKIRPQYFTAAEAAWEAQHAGGCR